ncbi:hypothetical protein [Streptomyces sp. NPDC048590]|uniref:hypothetical protein n=1 Tax=Streptomyces sp. NPDC048590 TaxID=3365574 RepID=UPI00371479A4
MPTRRRAAPRVLAVAVLSAAALRTALGPGVASASEPVALTLEDVARTMTAYPADEGARARNSVFQVPVGVVPGNREPARNIRVVVDASGRRPVTGTVRGRVGETVELRLGVDNLGPGEVRDEDGGRFEVIPPEGTTITCVPYSFEGDDHDWACTRPTRAGDAVVCGLENEAFPQVEDGSRTLTFHVRIDRQVEGARGTIRVFNPYDRSPGNDTAAIPLDASPASPASRPGPVLAVLAGCVLASAGAAVLYRRRRRARGA